MPLKPRLANLFGPDRPKPKRRPLITHDGTLIVQGESCPLAGEPLALDERPKPSRQRVTFDGAVPHPKTKDPNPCLHLPV